MRCLKLARGQGTRMNTREGPFPAIWGFVKPKNFLYAPRQPMVALRSDSRAYNFENLYQSQKGLPPFKFLATSLMASRGIESGPADPGFSSDALERKVGANTIQIVAILDIGFKSDGSPYLQFGGFYWNTNVADIEAFIPLVIPDLLTYIYSGKEQNVKLGVNEMMVLYWLSVNKGSVDFDQSRGSNGSFTMYKYIHTSASIPQTTIVILVPTDRPDMCVAATRRGDVILEDFDESRYLGPDPIIGNARFLELAQQDDGRYTIGSTVREDLYITKRENRAVLTETGSLFEIDGPPPNMQARNQGEMEKREEKGEEKTGEKKRGTGEEEGGDKKKKKERKGRKGGSRR
ncbi:uncharacterized protein [Apostichopus japonicus]|uniref:uncharacterized protein isoform X1 n=1 Tax=Stichopus japonicus TaxID=307972 RepID=UPI003AB1F2A7